MYRATLLQLCTFLPVLLSGQWTFQPAPLNDRYDDLYFLNADTGWACGGGGRIVRTHNGGAFWQVVLDQPGYLRSIEFSDAQHGICGSLDSLVYRTTDGGETWTEISDQLAQPVQGICGLSAPTPDIFYGSGVVFTPAFVVKSTDAGATWSHTDMSAHTEMLIDVLFFNADTGLATGGSWSNDQGMQILRTTDGGATWTQVLSTGTGNEWGWKLQSPDGIHVFASIEVWNPATVPTRIARSSDSGQTWTIDTVGPGAFRLQGIGFLTPQIGWTGDEYLFRSDDGGHTFTADGPVPGFNRFHRVNDHLAFAGAMGIYRYDDNTAGVASFPGMPELESITASPNPASGRVAVEARLHQPSWAHVELRNSTGQLLERLHDGWTQAGSLHLATDLSRHAPGTYHFVLFTSWGPSHAVVVKP